MCEAEKQAPTKINSLNVSSVLHTVRYGALQSIRVGEELLPPGAGRRESIQRVE